MRLFSYSFPFSIDLVRVAERLGSEYQVRKFEGALHLRPLNLEVAEGDVFIFSFGALVTWGLSVSEETKLCNRLSEFAQASLGAVDDDHFTYSYGDSVHVMADHVVLLSHDLSYKLACSFGFAQSVKLGGFEILIQKMVDRTRVLPSRLAKDGSIRMSKKEISRLMGQIFLDRHSINLHLDLLDIPNFFWNHPELEHVHKMVAKYMDVESRVGVLNQRLEVLLELAHMLVAELNNQHSSRLETIIVVLIFVEVLITFGKDIFHWI